MSLWDVIDEEKNKIHLFATNAIEKEIAPIVSKSVRDGKNTASININPNGENFGLEGNIYDPNISTAVKEICRILHQDGFNPILISSCGHETQWGPNFEFTKICNQCMYRITHYQRNYFEKHFSKSEWNDFMNNKEDWLQGAPALQEDKIATDLGIDLNSNWIELRISWANKPNSTDNQRDNMRAIERAEWQGKS